MKINAFNLGGSKAGDDWSLLGRIRNYVQACETWSTWDRSDPFLSFYSTQVIKSDVIVVVEGLVNKLFVFKNTILH